MWVSPKPRKVLVLDGEMNTSELRERLKKTLVRYPVEVAEAAARNIILVPRQIQHWETDFYDLNEKEYQDQLLESIALGVGGESIDLVVLDNFSCLADVDDENSSAAFNGICQFLYRAKTMTSVLLIHHTKKNSGVKARDGGMTYRGSSKHGGIMEVCIALSVPGEEERPSHRGAAFKVALEKFRGAPRFVN